MAEKIYTFKEALEKSSSSRSLLLGNGFSISLFPKIFTYSSLKDRASFEEHPFVQAVFDELKTSDFESVIRNLKSAMLVARAYKLDKEIIETWLADIAKVRDKLVEAIAGSHPSFPHEISDAQYISCRAFLRNFTRFYTLNYDLLLYWVLMRDDLDKKPLKTDDGFRTSPSDPDAEYVTWESHNSADVHYLHGALHLFDAGAELRKYTWVRTGVPLMKQIRTALDADMYPLFVAEGTSDSKVDRILHHAYLHRALRSFEGIGGSLFVFGHSLDDNDFHIFNLLKRCDNKVLSLFISIHGDQDRPTNAAIIQKAKAIEAARQKCARKLDVYFFDSDSAEVWTSK